jgi:hypothetical protein
MRRQSGNQAAFRFCFIRVIRVIRGFSLFMEQTLKAQAHFLDAFAVAARKTLQFRSLICSQIIENGVVGPRLFPPELLRFVH